MDGRFYPMTVFVWKLEVPSLVVDQEQWKLIEQHAPESWTAAYTVGKDSAGNTRWSAPWSIRRVDETWVAERLR